MPTLGTDAVLVLLLTLGLLLALVFEKASPAQLGAGLLLVLPALGLLPFEVAAGGFANKGVLTLAGLFILGEALTRTGAVTFVGRVILRRAGGSRTRILLLSTASAALISAFLNDTAVVVVFLPILLDLGRRGGIPASHLLMPLAFASLLGGMCTLVGTSTNLIVSGAAEDLGAPPLTLLSLAPVGVPTAIVAIVVIVWLAPRLLPDRRTLSDALDGAVGREYVSELLVQARSPAIGRRVEDALAGSGLRAVLLVRGEAVWRAPFAGQAVQAGDVLVVQGDAEAIGERAPALGLAPWRERTPDLREVELFELAVSPRSPLVASRVGDLELHEGFGVEVLALLRSGQHLYERIAEIRLQSGDLLLVCGSEASRDRLRASGDFYLLASPPVRLRLPSLAKRALWVTGGVMVALLLQSIFGVASFPPAAIALTGALLAVQLRCLPSRAAYRAVDWSVILFIVGALALGKAMERTGVATLAAEKTVDQLLPLGPGAVASGLVLLCFLFNFLISHAAVAALFAPVAVAAARQVAAAQGHDPGSAAFDDLTRMMLLAVCFGGSMCFASPMAHQVNLMVMEPGGYRFRDFVRLGTLVGVVVWAMVSLLLPRLA